MDGVAGKRKRFRSGYKREFFGKTFSRGGKLLPDTTAAKTAGKPSSLRTGDFSLSHTRATEEEHAQQARESGRCTQAGQSGVRSPSTGRPTQGHATSSLQGPGPLQLQQTQHQNRGG